MPHANAELRKANADKTNARAREKRISQAAQAPASRSTPKAEAAHFNANYPPGTPVRYWSTLPRPGEPKPKPTGRTITVGVAFVMGGHAAMIKLKGVSGSYALRNVEPIGKPRPATDVDKKVAAAVTCAVVNVIVDTYKISGGDRRTAEQVAAAYGLKPLKQADEDALLDGLGPERLEAFRLILTEGDGSGSS
jgi:hypothetical protein